MFYNKHINTAPELSSVRSKEISDHNDLDLGNPVSNVFSEVIFLIYIILPIPYIVHPLPTQTP